MRCFPDGFLFGSWRTCSRRSSPNAPAGPATASEALDHYAAIVDSCAQRGLAAVVTLNHMTCPHWFAKRGGCHAQRAEPAAAALLGGRAGVGTEVGAGHPGGGQRRRRVPRYRVSTMMLPEEFDAMRDGMTAGHLAAVRR